MSPILKLCSLVSSPGFSTPTGAPEHLITLHQPHRVSSWVKTRLSRLPSESQADPSSGSSPASWLFPNPNHFVSLQVSSTTTRCSFKPGPFAVPTRQQHQAALGYLQYSYPGKALHNTVVCNFLMQKVFDTR